MGKIPAPRLQEIIFGSSDKTESNKLRQLLKQRLIQKIAPRIYTSNFHEEPSAVIRRNWYRIVAHQYPDALISHRSALEFRPTPSGHIYVTANYTRTVNLPGLIIHLLEGPPAIDGDKPFFEQLRVSQQARAFLENLQPSRGAGEEVKTLSQASLEEELEKVIRSKGEPALNQLRDTAKEIAGPLEMQKEFEKLTRLISAMLSTGESKQLKSDGARARLLGEPFDAGRMDLLENLHAALATRTFPEFPDYNKSDKAYRNFAFYESYFSNYIEGTEFTIAEARHIITAETPLPAREEDSHDILGTFQIVGDRREMQLLPMDRDALLAILRERHAVLLRSRTAKNPGEFKDKNNRAGNTEFVDKELVIGTLKKGMEWYQLLKHPFARAAFMMFLVSEVHPFLDGNGRIARVMMNAELSSAGLSKIIIPTVFREDYIGALKQFTNQRQPDAYIRMLERAWAFSSGVYGEDATVMEDFLHRCRAFEEQGQLLSIYRLPVTGPGWQFPLMPVRYGKNILIRSSVAGMQVQVFNAAGSSRGQVIQRAGENVRFLAADIGSILPAMLRFQTDGELADVEVEFE